MPMLVVRIRHMRVGMGLRFVVVQVAMHAFAQGAVHMIVVAICVVVRVFVVQRRVFMPVAVRLHQVQQHAAQHQQATSAHPCADRAVAHGQRQRSANKGCKREDRAGARRTKCALRQQVKTQAQAVAGGAHGQQSGCGAPARRGL